MSDLPGGNRTPDRVINQIVCAFDGQLALHAAGFFPPLRLDELCVRNVWRSAVKRVGGLLAGFRSQISGLKFSISGLCGLVRVRFRSQVSGLRFQVFSSVPSVNSVLKIRSAVGLASVSSARSAVKRIGSRRYSNQPWLQLIEMFEVSVGRDKANPMLHGQRSDPVIGIWKAKPEENAKPEG